MSTTSASPAHAPTTQPALNGQIIGQAERSTRAVLERLLAESGTPFHQWVTLNLLGGAPHSEPELVEHLSSGLLIDRAAAQAAVDAARSAGLIVGVDDVVFTATGQDRFDAITAGIAGITKRLYSDLPHEDLVIARRVLESLTERARTALAA